MSPSGSTCAGRWALRSTVKRRPLRVPPVVAESGRQALRDAGWDGAEPVLLLHPGAGSAAKRWSAEGFATVARDVEPREGACPGRP